MIRTININTDQTVKELTIEDAINRPSTMHIQNNGTHHIVIGTSAVSETNFGVNLEPGDKWIIELNQGDRVYASSHSSEPVSIIILDR